MDMFTCPRCSEPQLWSEWAGWVIGQRERPVCNPCGSELSGRLDRLDAIVRSTMESRR